MKSGFSILSNLYISGVTNPFVDIHVGAEIEGGGLPGHTVEISLGRSKLLSISKNQDNIVLFLNGR